MYFSVRKPFRIAGRLYKPCICYDMPENLRVTLNRLVEDGLATVSEEPMYFQSGAMLEPKAEPPRTRAERLASRRKRVAKPAAEEPPKGEPEPADEAAERMGF